MIRKILTIICIGAFVLVQGCSPKSANIKPKPPAANYEDLSCQHIDVELQRVAERLYEAERGQDARANTDLALTWVFTGFVIAKVLLPSFLFALLFLNSENEPYQVAEYKGYRDHLQSIQSEKCAIS